MSIKFCQICGTFRRSVLVFNLFKCDHTECKTRPARRLTLQPMCFLHVADVDKNLYWLRIYILDWHGIMDHYVKVLVFNLSHFFSLGHGIECIDK